MDASDTSRLMIGLGTTGALSVVLHCIIETFAPTLAAVISPIHALCCAGILMLLHPAVPAMIERYAAFGGNIDPTSLMYDPVIQAARRLQPPPMPWQQTIHALGLAAIADFCEGMRGYTYRGVDTSSSVARAWEGAHEALAAASVSCLLYGSWRLGLPPSRFLQAACWGVAASGGAQLILSADPPPAEAGWAALGCIGLAACRTAVSCALAARSASSLSGAIVANSRGRSEDVDEADGGGADVMRWALQAVGSVLLLARPSLAAILPAGGGSLALVASRLGYATISFSTYLSLFPPLLPERDETSLTSEGGYQSIAQMKEARRAARDAMAKRRAEMPPPLLQDSKAGGVQGLRWHDLSLCRDADGDEAHDFWEAITGGRFRRMIVGGCTFPSAEG